MVFQRQLVDLFNVQNRINKIRRDPDTTPSENILQKRSDLEINISKDLKNGEVIKKDSFFDYCIYHFHSNGNYNSRSVFDVMPKVQKFVDYVEKNHGESILSTYNHAPNECGIISGEVEFRIDPVNNWRSLYVPVEKLLKFQKGEFGSVKNQGLYVHSDIFKYLSPAANLSSNYWSTYYTERCIGGDGPEKKEIYIGKAVVERELKKTKMPVALKSKSFLDRLGKFF
jgi:hypothetical protein